MPYESKAQQRYFHANEDKIGASVVKEFDKSTNFKKLPEKKKPKAKAKGKAYKQFL